MTPSDTGWRMNSDTWLPTAPARVTLTKPPVNTENALRMHANQAYIEAAQTEHSESDHLSKLGIGSGEDVDRSFRDGRLRIDWRGSIWKSRGPNGFHKTITFGDVLRCFADGHGANESSNDGGRGAKRD